jgi:hypothetical protein
VCTAAPLSDQLAKTYCVPLVPACAAAAAIVCVEPGVHCNIHGDVQAALSTVSDNPAGELVTVTATVGPAAPLSCGPTLKNDPGAF